MLAVYTKHTKMDMETELEIFQKAANYVKATANNLDASVLLYFYARFKQVYYPFIIFITYAIVTRQWWAIIGIMEEFLAKLQNSPPAIGKRSSINIKGTS